MTLRLLFFNYYLVSFVLFSGLLISCSSDSDSDPKPSNPDPDPTSFTITVNPGNTHQQMVGFGGALTWYSNWMTTSSKKTEIADLIFNDLGIDIIRFKSWYYPDGYPAVTSTDVMSDDNSKIHWDATNELYTLAKDRNPDVKILLSSWGPPAGLKSNNSSREGTLKKTDGNFMYDEFATYWEQTLDHLPFNPDYISIQNEPTYINSGWTTCDWSYVETATLPDYTLAFDKVHDLIKDRTNPPVMIGPESQDIPTFGGFANILKNKAHCGLLAYHPYNINATTSGEQIIASLKSIGSFTEKPNIMTEYSDAFNWFATAQFIQNTLLHANSSGYIYWKLVWAQPAAGVENAAMVSITSGGAYTVTPFYYVMKHFAKHIDAGYQRVDASTTNANLLISAFKNPTNNKITVIVINKGVGQVSMDFEVTGKSITTVEAYQSKEANYYKEVENITASDEVVFPAQSVTTVVLSI